MRNLKYLFTVPKGEKVTEKHLRRVLISSVVSILLCMTCLVSTTWAWFTVSITSENNEIRIGTFAVEVSVEKTGENEEYAPQMPSDGILTQGEYMVTIKNTGDCGGFCLITLTDDTGGETILTTPTISGELPVNLTITVLGGEVNMTITNHWGQSPEERDSWTGSVTVGQEPVEETTEPAPPTESTGEQNGSEEDDIHADDPDVPGEDEAPAGDPNGSTEETAAPTESDAPTEDTTVPETEQSPNLV